MDKYFGKKYKLDKGRTMELKKIQNETAYWEIMKKGKVVGQSTCPEDEIDEMLQDNMPDDMKKDSD